MRRFLRLCKNNLSIIFALSLMLVMLKAKGRQPMATVTISPNVVDTDAPGNINVPAGNISVTGFTGSRTYSWSAVSKPDGITGDVNIVPGFLGSAQFIGFNALGTPQAISGIYEFELRVSDTNGNVATTIFTIVQIPPVNSPPLVTIDPLPTSDLLLPVTNVLLEGIIEDPTNEISTSAWSQASGSTAISFPTIGIIPIGTRTTETDINLNDLQPGTYELTLSSTDDGGLTGTASITFNVLPPPSSLAVSIDPVMNPESPVPINGTITGINELNDRIRYEWTQDPGNPATITLPEAAFVALGNTEQASSIEVADVPFGSYTFTLTATDEYYNVSEEASVTILFRPPVVIEPSKVFTPNGDGINDEWVVGNVEDFPELAVTIINERGAIVFEAQSYATERWNGLYNGQAAPEGAYYYVFTDTIDGTEIRGSFVLLR